MVRLVVLCLSGIWRLPLNPCPAPLGWPGLLGSQFGCYLERLTLRTVHFWKALVYHLGTRLKCVFSETTNHRTPLVFPRSQGVLCWKSTENIEYPFRAEVNNFSIEEIHRQQVLLGLLGNIS